MAWTPSTSRRVPGLQPLQGPPDAAPGPQFQPGMGVGVALRGSGAMGSSPLPEEEPGSGRTKGSKRVVGDPSPGMPNWSVGTKALTSPCSRFWILRAMWKIRSWVGVRRRFRSFM